MKAVALLSGLDSMIAAKIIQEQGISVYGISFSSAFFDGFDSEKYKLKAMPVKKQMLGLNYIRIIRSPKHGYGRYMNPCIDCKIFMLKKAKAYMKKIGADFIITGDVVGERPFSQKKNALFMIEKEAGLGGKILRPLSAKLLPETEPEKKGWVDRKKLYAISGRRRLLQMKLAKKFGIKNYPTPGGGCLLTYEKYADKVKDLIKHEKKMRIKDFQMLKIGRHFRFGKNKIVVGRNHKENLKLRRARGDDYIFEAENIMGPSTLLLGPKTKKAIEKAASLTARYSDSRKRNVLIRYGKKLEKEMIAKKVSKKEIEKIRV